MLLEGTMQVIAGVRTASSTINSSENPVTFSDDKICIGLTVTKLCGINQLPMIVFRYCNVGGQANISHS